MTKFRISPALIIGLLLIAFFAISLVFRICYPFNQLYIGDTIKYANNDSYYYMRLVDNVANHFPQLTQFDPYYIFPGGFNANFLSLFHWIIAFLAWMFGAGHPTQHLIDIIGTYLPAIMAALTIIPVFFIGKTLFNKWVGLLSAGLIAILPGEFVARSMLGATDTPVAEIFFTTTALAFLISAIKIASQRQMTFSHIAKREWNIILKPIILGLFAGLFLGFYMASWQGALIFVFIICLYLIIQFIVNHHNHKSSDYLCIVSVVTFLIALIILALNAYATDIIVAMVLALLIPIILWGISKFLSSRGLNVWYYPLMIIGIGIIAIVLVRFITPGNFNGLWAKIQFVFFPSGASAATTTEMSPVLIPQGDFTTVVAWGNFTTSFFFAPWWLLGGFAAALICGFIAYSANRQKLQSGILGFLIVATGILILLTVQQVPSSYGIGDSDVKFIPGTGFIALSILLYLFVKKGKEQPWYIAVGWVLAILILLVAMILFATFDNLRYLTLIPLAVLVYILLKHHDKDEDLRLFVIWCIVMIVLPMIQRRFQYYLVINFALLSGYLAWEIIRVSGVNQLLKRREDDTKKVLDFSAAPQKQNYYEALGVNKNASYKEIKAAFRRLTASYQPGVSHKAEEETHFKFLNKAQEVLTNPSQRAAYDNTQREEFERNKWRSRKGGHSNALNVVNIVLSIVVVFLFIFCPNLSKMQAQASQVPYAASNDWQVALDWMRNNTPDPMGNPDAYYKYYSALKPGEKFNYPASAYGVTSWWDYGYWITRIAHRIPSANPSQSADPVKKVAAFFLSENQTAWEAIRKDLQSLYVVSDYDTSVGKYPAMVDWAGLDDNKYNPVYYVVQGNQLIPIQVFGEEYYRTLIVRLYNFDAKAVTQAKPTVVAYTMLQVSTTLSVKEIGDVKDIKDFNSYQEALDYIKSQSSSGKLYDIISTDPFTSPIPLPAVENYKEIYNSVVSTNSTQPVKIFQYIGNQ